MFSSSFRAIFGAKLRGFDIFHNDKILFIIIDQESFPSACDFQLITLLKLDIEAQLRNLDLLIFIDTIGHR